MKILMFSNESGDDTYPICIIDKKLNKKQLKKIVINNIGDDYIKEYDVIYGQYYIQDFSNLKLASTLL